MSNVSQWLCGTALGLVVGALLDASVGRLVFVNRNSEQLAGSVQARRCSCKYCTCCKACKKRENP